MTYLLPDDLRRALLAYLAERPWREVAEAMPKLLALVQAPEAAGTGVAGVEPTAPAVAPEKG